MSTNLPATRKDIGDVLSVLDVMMTRFDDRFTKGGDRLEHLESRMQNILNQLDGIEKRLEISDDERGVMAHQLTQLHNWVEKAAERLDIKFSH